MMTAESMLLLLLLAYLSSYHEKATKRCMLSKRPVFRFTVALLFLLKLLSITFFKIIQGSRNCVYVGSVLGVVP